MKTRNLLSIFLFCIYITAHTQPVKTFRHEFTAITENDDYTLRLTDRYYSNGLFVRYSSAIKDIEEQKPGSAKKLFSVELGQQMFNPYKHDQNYAAYMDRPYAGVLYIKPSLTRINANEHVWQYGLQGGIMGPSAFGKQVQTWWHGVFNIYKVYGWDTQLKDEAFINLKASYHHHLLQKQKEKPWFDLYAFGATSLGNNLTNATAGLQFKFGAFEKAFNSVAWNARVQKTKELPQYRKNHEVYFYVEPQFTYQVYNAVLQGGLFRKEADKGGYTTSIRRLVYQHNFGLMYAQYRWTVQFGYVFKTREAENQIAIENYGVMRLGYRFR